MVVPAQRVAVVLTLTFPVAECNEQEEVVVAAALLPLLVLLTVGIVEVVGVESLAVFAQTSPEVFQEEGECTAVEDHAFLHQLEV